MASRRRLTNNMKHYEDNLNQALLDGDHAMVNYYNDQIGLLQDKLKARDKNKRKNEKLNRKAN